MHTIRRTFLITLILSLTLSALAGIFIFLAGSFGELQNKTLLTTIAIDIFSLAGLVNASLLDKGRLKYYSYVSLAISTLAFLMVLQAIWVNFFANWKMTLDFVIISFACTHVSLMFLINDVGEIVEAIRGLTIMFVVVTAGMLIFITNGERISSDLYYRVLGVLAIIDVLGTVTTPIINKISK